MRAASVRASHKVRQATAPIAWFAAVAFAAGLIPLLWLGIPPNSYESNCGTLFDDGWRSTGSSCRGPMLNWLRWEIALGVLALTAGCVWWVAFRRDSYRQPWKL